MDLEPPHLSMTGEVAACEILDAIVKIDVLNWDEQTARMWTVSANCNLEPNGVSDSQPNEQNLWFSKCLGKISKLVSRLT